MSSSKICKKISHAFFPISPQQQVSLRPHMDTNNLAYSILSYSVEVQRVVHVEREVQQVLSLACYIFQSSLPHP